MLLRSAGRLFRCAAPKHATDEDKQLLLHTLRVRDIVSCCCSLPLLLLLLLLGGLCGALEATAPLRIAHLLAAAATAATATAAAAATDRPARR